MVTTKLNLSMTEPSVRQIYAKQGDTGRVLDITLDQTPEDGTLRILRPDGVEVTSEAVTGGEVESGGTFESLTEADVTELTVGIEPVQDLNGYDKPWVGGAGKNKLNNTQTTTTYNGVTFTVNSDGTVTANGTASGDASFIIRVDTSSVYGDFYFNALYGYTSDTSYNAYMWDTTTGARCKQWDGTTNSVNSYNGTLRQVKIVQGNTVYMSCRVMNGVTANNVVFYPMIVASTETDPTWQPYSNICPITGHDEVTVYDDPVYGKAIKWNQLIKNGNFADTSNWTVSSGSSYTVSNNVATFRADARYRSLTQATPPQERVPKLNHVYMGIIKAKSYTDTDTFFYVRTVASAILQTASKTLKTTEKEYVNVLKVTQEAYYFQFMVQDNNASGYGDITIQNARFFDLTLMFGSTVADYIYSLEQANTGAGVAYFRNLFPKDYYPYDNSYTETCVSAVNGDAYLKYTTSLGQTVYGGTLDMVSGVLTVDSRYLTVDDFSEFNGGVSTGGLHWVNVPKSRPAGVNDDTSTNVCSHAPYSSNNTTGWLSRTPMYNVNSGGFPARIYVASASLADFKTEYATLQAVYKLAKPVTYQLTPQQIKTLVGTNNVWASSGQIVSIKFTYGGLLSELPSEATEIVGKCYCDVEQNGVSSMPFTLNVKKNERES